MVCTYTLYVNHTLYNRSYKQPFHCLIHEGNEFVDYDREIVAHIKTVKSVTEFPDDFRPATVYRLCDDHDKVCLYFGEDEYKGLDSNRSYLSLVDGVLFDGDSG